MQIDQGGVKYIFYWAGDVPGGTHSEREQSAEMGFGSSPQALSFLRRFQDFGRFRTLLQERYPAQIKVWRPENILEKTADELVKKHLRVVKRWEPAEASPPATGVATYVPRRNPQPITSSPEPSTFPPSHDGDNQAEALINASENASPFCEECEKAKA